MNTTNNTNNTVNVFDVHTDTLKTNVCHELAFNIHPLYIVSVIASVLFTYIYHGSSIGIRAIS